MFALSLHAGQLRHLLRRDERLCARPCLRLEMGLRPAAPNSSDGLGERMRDGCSRRRNEPLGRAGCAGRVDGVLGWSRSQPPPDGLSLASIVRALALS